MVGKRFLSALIDKERHMLDELMALFPERGITVTRESIRLLQAFIAEPSRRIQEDRDG